MDTNSWSPYADRAWGKNFQIWPFHHYSLFRGRKPSKTWLQRESLTLEINDTICYNKVSDHYTANSTESLYSRYSQRYSGSTEHRRTSIFKGKMYPVASYQFFLRSPMQWGFSWFFSIYVWGKSSYTGEVQVCRPQTCQEQPRFLALFHGQGYDGSRAFASDTNHQLLIVWVHHELSIIPSLVPGHRVLDCRLRKVLWLLIIMRQFIKFSVREMSEQWVH